MVGHECTLDDCFFLYASIEYWGAGFVSVTHNQDETYFPDLGHGGACTAFSRGCLGDIFEGTRTSMFDGITKVFALEILRTKTP